MITTLEVFGLNEGYMNCVGHWPTWEKDQEKANGKKKKAAKKPAGKTSYMDRQRQLHAEKTGTKAIKPTHFDLDPLR